MSDRPLPEPLIFNWPRPGASTRELTERLATLDEQSSRGGWALLAHVHATDPELLEDIRIWSRIGSGESFSRVAIVSPEAEARIRLQLAAARSGADVRVFAGEQTAREWLRGGELESGRSTLVDPVEPE